jgi:hypothetical protein
VQLDIQENRRRREPQAQEETVNSVPDPGIHKRIDDPLYIPARPTAVEWPEKKNIDAG